MGYLRFLPCKDLWKSLKTTISFGDIISREKIVEKLDMMGYERQDLVTKTGEYANRGYILDVFPYGLENPVRIEFFDDEIDKIRTFDASSQLSKEDLKSVEILPFTEFINEKK